MINNLMNEQDIHEFGLQILVQWLEGKGYSVEFVQPDKNSLPHVFARAGEMLTLIIASTGVYPAKGSISETDKAAALELAQKLGAQCACARLGIANADGVEKKDKKLAAIPLKNGRFVTDFGGLEFIRFED
ncbi:MAG: hypothetical protein SPI71_04070 [Acidaminococcaceae bacterium]|nr:hypothetical protein [Acidaminococcaceae bacterium]